MQITVFDSGAGGYHVARVLTEAGHQCEVRTLPDLFPFGEQPRSVLIDEFHKFRNSIQGPIYCACNTMSLVLLSEEYDFEKNEVIPVLPNMFCNIPIYGTKMTCRLVDFARRVRPEIAFAPVFQASYFVKLAERLYRGQITRSMARAQAQLLFSTRGQLGSTHLSYLAHELGVASSHMEPDYVQLLNSFFGIEQ